VQNIAHTLVYKQTNVTTAEHCTHISLQANKRNNSRTLHTHKSTSKQT